MLGGNFPQRDNSRNPQDSVKGQGAGPAAHAGEASTSDAQVVLVSNRDPFDWREEGVPVQITVVGPADLPELLPLMRAYCDFYQVAPSDQALLELSQALLVDPQREGLQLLARDDTGRAVGFATLFWTWQTLAAARVGVMNDLYVAAEARGTGVADGLIAACLERCREHGATQLVWQTARDNHRAQAVYERIGANREDRWLDYQLPVDPG